jgi:DNA-binding NtrC family response regulator
MGAPNLDFSARGSMLGSGDILIVEDEYLIAADLEAQIREDGGRTARLALSIAAAEEELRDKHAIAGVILDVNVGEIPSLGLADALVRDGIPFVFFTGYRSMSLPDRFGAIPRVAKPANWLELKTALLAARQRIIHAGLGNFRDSVEAALPALRSRARNLVRNPEEADRLVEQTLNLAISDVGDRSLRITIEDWLLTLLERTSSQGGGRLMN